MYYRRFEVKWNQSNWCMRFYGYSLENIVIFCHLTMQLNIGYKQMYLIPGFTYLLQYFRWGVVYSAFSQLHEKITHHTKQQAGLKCIIIPHPIVARPPGLSGPMKEIMFYPTPVANPPTGSTRGGYHHPLVSCRWMVLPLFPYMTWVKLFGPKCNPL